MGWAETAREERRAPIGEYQPERYRVTVYDTFEQYRLRMAALMIANGMTIPEFFLYCAEYVIDHHRKFKHFRAVFRRGARLIRSTCRSVDHEQQDRCRRAALDRFADGAGPELRAEFNREP